MFKTTGKINKDFYNEIKPYALPPKSKYVNFFVIVFASLFLLSSLFFKYYMYSIIFLAFIIMLILEYFLLRNKTIKVQLKRMYETTGKEEVEYTVFFEDDGVVSENHSTGASAKITFDKFVKLKKSKSYILLFTKMHQFVPVFADCLSDAEKEELISFLKTNIPKLK